MARTPFQILEDDVREEARKSTAKKLVSLYWALPVACLGAVLYCLSTTPPGAQLTAVLAAVLAAAGGVSLGFGLTWTFWVVAKEDEITELKKRPTAEDVERMERSHSAEIQALAKAIETREAELSRLVPDESIRSILERYGAMKDAGNAPRIILQTHETIRMDGGRGELEVARLKRELDARQAELDSLLLEISEERKHPRKAIESGEYSNPSEEVLLSLPAALAGAIYKAFVAGGVIKFGPHDKRAQDTMAKSVRSRDGAFDFYFTISPLGSPNPIEGFQLEKPWMAWLNDPIHLDQLKAVSGTWWISEA